MIPIPTLALGASTLKLLLGIGCALLLALLIHDRNHWKAKTSHYAALLAAERGAHAATVANYRAAAERARRQDADNVIRVKAEQAGINERIANDLESRLAAARAVAQRLRGTAAAADSGGRRNAPMPGLPAAAESAAQAAGENGFPESDKRVGFPEGQLGADDALTATEQAIQLDELILWVKAQAAVDAGGRQGRN